MALNSRVANTVEEVSIKPVKSHQAAADLSLVRETAQSQQQELDSLRQQASRLNHLLQVMPAGVIVLDGKGYVRQANEQASLLLGEPLEGELWRLERAWQEAEEIAAISDGLLLPTDADDFIEKHREDTGGGAKPL